MYKSTPQWLPGAQMSQMECRTSMPVSGPGIFAFRSRSKVSKVSPQKINQNRAVQFYAPPHLWFAIYHFHEKCYHSYCSRIRSSFKAIFKFGTRATIFFRQDAI
jgi:hypothetical protein